MSKVKHRLTPREMEATLKELKSSFYRDYILDVSINTLLPSLNELTQKYSISVAIARRFYNQMQKDGVIVSKPRKGYFVAESAEVKISSSDHKTHTIGVVGYLDMQHPDVSTSRTFQILNGFEKIANEQGWQVHFFNTYPHKFIDHEITIAMAKAPLSAVLWLLEEQLDNDIRELCKLDLPLITFESMSEFATNINFDNFLLGQNATRYLIKTGFKKIAFVTNSVSVWSQKRKSGYLKTLEHNMLSGFVCEIETSESAYKECVRELIANNVDAVFCVNDDVAFKLKDMGLGWEHIAIMGVDNSIASWHYNLTSIQRNYNLMAETAFKHLVNYFIHNIPLPRSIMLKGFLLKRSSTETVKKNKKEILYA